MLTLPVAGTWELGGRASAVFALSGRGDLRARARPVPDGSNEPGDKKYILNLSQVSSNDLPEVGVKAANLGELLRAGFPVPEALVLTTRAYRLFMSENRIVDELTDFNEGSVSMPKDIQVALSDVQETLGNVILAVRSSGVQEDLATRSFAGQYETILGVKSKDELEDAVRKCWLSPFGKAATEYRRQHSQDRAGEMGVVIQRLVRADASGVAFTVHPVTGENKVLVNAVRGLGDRLVSGGATPDEWVVDQKVTLTSVVEDAITQTQAQEIADLARKVERLFGGPQDIEWAIAGGHLFLLQARPITTLPRTKAPGAIKPIPIPIDVPAGHWNLDVDHFPRPMSPMYISYGLSTVTELMKLGAKDLGLPFEGIEFKQIGGWTYGRVVPPGGKDRKPPPKAVMQLLVHLVPSVRSQVRRMVEVVRTDVFGQYLDRWNNEWRSELVEAGSKLRGVNLGALSDDELDRHLSSVLEYVKRAKEIHFRYLTWPLLAVGELAIACQELLDWSNLQVLDLLAGLSLKDSEPSQRLTELVALVKHDKKLSDAVVEAIKTGNTSRASSISPLFDEKFTLYLKDFGAAALGYEVIDPTVAEVPIELFRLIQDQIAVGYDPTSKPVELERKRTAAEAALIKRASGSSDEAKVRITQVLARARRAYAIHDDEVFYTQNVPDGMTRYALLEVGKRLTAKNQTTRREDVFMLTLGEARESMKNGRDMREVVARRLGERAWAEVNPGQPSYGEAPPPPPLDVFPTEVKQILRSMLWALDAAGIGRGGSEGSTLQGVPASSGRFTGRVRVVRDESEFDKIQVGDILVCPSAAPSWSVIFPSVSAVVTEAGGILSHPAIIAREYGIPAVMAVPGATRKLKDGQMVTVDGDHGTVVVAS